MQPQSPFLYYSSVRGIGLQRNTPADTRIERQITSKQVILKAVPLSSIDKQLLNKTCQSILDSTLWAKQTLNIENKKEKTLYETSVVL